MRLWILVALGLAVPALAQESMIEVQPLEPLIAPGATQNRDGGGIVVRPVEPLTDPAASEGSDGDLLGEGFNDNAFRSDGRVEDAPLDEGAGSFDDALGDGEGSFIDRAFGTPREPEEEPDAARAPELRSDGPLPDVEGEDDAAWFGLDSGSNEDPLSEADDAPRFKSAPYTTRGLYGPSEPNALPRIATVPMEGAEIRQLDKMTGATRTVSIKAGQEQRIGRLRVLLRGCHAPADGSEHGTRAFLQVWDPERQRKNPAFSGWMFADSPALSALDHPRYDVWVLGCTPTRAAGTAPTGESESDES